ncbi:MAG: PQQ-dependent sugar dehydrogenase, partial [Caldilinea sp.]|nr:PQQ-dependent sugar dehydrogenase [Caldilinea sp.]
VFALGLRNPFRFSVDPRNGRVIVGEVGNEKWEEINVGGPGANFGWPCYEGPYEAATYAN